MLHEMISNIKSKAKQDVASIGSDLALAGL